MKWHRLAILPPLVLLTSASSPPMPDVNEAGRVLATLNDVRVFVFALMFLLFLQTIERWWSGYRMGKTADKFAHAADKLTEAVNTMAGSATISSLQMQQQMTVLAAEIGRLR